MPPSCVEANPPPWVPRRRRGAPDDAFLGSIWRFWPGRMRTLFSDRGRAAQGRSTRRRYGSTRRTQPTPKPAGRPACGGFGFDIRLHDLQVSRCPARPSFGVPVVSRAAPGRRRVDGRNAALEKRRPLVGAPAAVNRCQSRKAPNTTLWPHLRLVKTDDAESQTSIRRNPLPIPLDRESL